VKRRAKYLGEPCQRIGRAKQKIVAPILTGANFSIWNQKKAWRAAPLLNIYEAHPV
jgi:hypothetical protein